MCCNSQITCSVITRIAAIHWKEEVSKVHSDNSYSSDLLDVKFEFWPVYVNHIYVFIGIDTRKQNVCGLDSRTELTLRPAHISNVLCVFILLTVWLKFKKPQQCPPNQPNFLPEMFWNCISISFWKQIQCIFWVGLKTYENESIYYAKRCFAKLDRILVWVPQKDKCKIK